MDDDLSHDEMPLAAGPAVVRTIDLAAGLARLTAGVSGREDLEERARALARKAAPLAAEDAAAYEEFLRTRSAEARARTIELPVRMGELAAAAAELSVEVVEAGRGAVRGDAAAGALLAEGAARAAALLVRLNGGGAQELSRAEAAAGRAARAAARV